MKNSGYVAIGHLLNQKKSQADNVSILSNFVNILNLTLQDGLIEKTDSLKKFEQFFKSADDVSLQSFVRFLDGILLKNSECDRFKLQLNIEEIVWSMIKPNKINANHMKWFGIFNRLW